MGKSYQCGMISLFHYERVVIFDIMYKSEIYKLIKL